MKKRKDSKRNTKNKRRNIKGGSNISDIIWMLFAIILLLLVIFIGRFFYNKISEVTNYAGDKISEVRNYAGDKIIQTTDKIKDGTSKVYQEVTEASFIENPIINPKEKNLDEETNDSPLYAQKRWLMESLSNMMELFSNKNQPENDQSASNDHIEIDIQPDASNDQSASKDHIAIDIQPDASNDQSASNDPSASNDQSIESEFYDSSPPSLKENDRKAFKAFYSSLAEHNQNAEKNDKVRGGNLFKNNNILLIWLFIIIIFFLRV